MLSPPLLPNASATERKKETANSEIWSFQTVGGKHTQTNKTNKKKHLPSRA
jgi:hypothetical protein